MCFKRRAALGFARFEELLYAGKTLSDVARGSYTARMEGTHRKLGAGLAYRLGGDYADCLAHLHGGVGGHILAVALCAHAVARVAAEYRADGYLLYACIDYLLCNFVGYELVLSYEEVALFVEHVLRDEPALNSVFKSFDNFAVGPDYRLYHHTAGLFGTRHTVLFAHDNVLRYVYKTAGKVARFFFFFLGIGKAFTAAV